MITPLKVITFVITSLNLMVTKIIRIGNSRGIRLSKSVLADLPHISGFRVRKSGNEIILTPIETSREKWEAQITAVSKDIEETPDYTHNKFDSEEWEW